MSMKLVLLFDHRYQSQPDGSVRSPTQYSYDLFARRYLDVFERVQVICRVDDGKHRQITFGPNVELILVGDWTGSWGYQRAKSWVRPILNEHLQPGSAVIAISPGMMADIALPILQRRRMPFGVEVVSDGAEIVGAGGARSPLRCVVQWALRRSLRQLCRHAACAAYVTRETLQRRYPASPGVYTTHYSSIELLPEHFADSHRDTRRCRDPKRLVCVGTMVRSHKGQDVLLRALAECRARGLDLRLTLIGDGGLRPQLESLSRQLGIADVVDFVGRLPPGGAIRDALDAADLYVQPSLSDALPRALIEAMARGLPCLATSVSGVPELLASEDLVAPGDPVALAQGICSLLSNPERMSQASRRNLIAAGDYRDSDLRRRRRTFYEHLRDLTPRHHSQTRAA